MQERTRSFWGWGYADESIPNDLLQQSKLLVKIALGLDELRHIEAPTLDALNLPEPSFALPQYLKSICTDSPYDRAAHSYGKSFRDVIRALYAQFDNPPDYVAFPRDEAQIQALMQFCEQEAVALIPYGGGSSVVGGIEPPNNGRAISCDMRHFNQIIHVDEVSRTAGIQAGIFGPALEAGLKLHGFTLRHFPQSFEFSTLGGWIATRSGGHFATNYTHIDDFVQSVRMVTPQGIWETRAVPGSGAGPDPNRLILGSEGILGIITEATLRLQHIPTYRAAATVRFADENAAIEAVRRISQSGLFPANCRLISAMEAFSMGIANGQDTILLLGFEAHDHSQKPKLEHALNLCQRSKGVWSEKDVSIQNGAGQKRSETASTWRSNFMRAPYLRDAFIQAGLIIETFESAITWDKFAAFHQAVIEHTFAAITEQCEKGLLYWRFTHVYPDGPAPYYTLIAPAKTGQEIEQWTAIKAAASDAIMEQGGTITHHHAIGKDHRRWYEQQRSPLFGKILEQTKKTLDPHGILNPDVLIARKDSH